MYGLFSAIGNAAEYAGASNSASSFAGQTDATRGQINNAINNWSQPVQSGGSNDGWGFSPVQYTPVSYVAGSNPAFGYNNGGGAQQNWGGGQTTWAGNNTPAPAPAPAPTSSLPVATNAPYDANAAIKDYVGQVMAGSWTDAEKSSMIRNQAAKVGVSNEQIANATGYSLDNVNAYMGLSAPATAPAPTVTAPAKPTQAQIDAAEQAARQAHMDMGMDGRQQGVDPSVYNTLYSVNANGQVVRNSDGYVSPFKMSDIKNPNAAEYYKQNPQELFAIGALGGGGTQQGFFQDAGVRGTTAKFGQLTPDQWYRGYTSSFEKGWDQDTSDTYRWAGQPVTAAAPAAAPKPAGTATSSNDTNAAIKDYVGQVLAGNYTDAQRAEMIRNQATKYGITPDQIAAATGYDAATVNKYLALAPRAVSADAQKTAIRDYVGQVLSGNYTDEQRAQMIRNQAAQYGITPEQIADATGYDLATVNKYLALGTGTPGGQPSGGSAGGRPTGGPTGSPAGSPGGPATGAPGAGNINQGATGDFYNKQVPVKGYTTAGVDDRASQIYARLVGGVDRANAIAASQGFAQALRNGTGNSSAAGAMSDDITRKFADVYSKLAEDAAKGALAENQSNYASYLSGNQQAIGQNLGVGQLNNSINNSIMTNDTARMNAALQASTSLKGAVLNAETLRGNAALQAMIQMYGADRVSLANAQNARGKALNNLLANPAVQGLGQSAVNAVLSRLGGNQNPTQAQILDAINNNPDLSPADKAGMLNIFGDNYTGNPYDDVGVNGDWWGEQGVSSPGYDHSYDYFYTN